MYLISDVENASYASILNNIMHLKVIEYTAQEV
jgi:hypothetical protein